MHRDCFSQNTHCNAVFGHSVRTDFTTQKSVHPGAARPESILFNFSDYQVGKFNPFAFPSHRKAQVKCNPFVGIRTDQSQTGKVYLHRPTHQRSAHLIKNKTLVVVRKLKVASGMRLPHFYRDAVFILTFHFQISKISFEIGTNTYFFSRACTP